jgi:hypothetical protein
LASTLTTLSSPISSRMKRARSDILDVSADLLLKRSHPSETTLRGTEPYEPGFTVSKL